jgi:hypothetical protein
MVEKPRVEQRTMGLETQTLKQRRLSSRRNVLTAYVPPNCVYTPNPNNITDGPISMQTCVHTLPLMHHLCNILQPPSILPSNTTKQMSLVVPIHNLFAIDRILFPSKHSHVLTGCQNLSSLYYGQQANLGLHVRWSKMAFVQAVRQNDTIDTATCLSFLVIDKLHRHLWRLRRGPRAYKITSTRSLISACCFRHLGIPCLMSYCASNPVTPPVSNGALMPMVLQSTTPDAGQVRRIFV